MLKTFFNRSSPMIFILNAIAAIEIVLLLVHGPFRGTSPLGFSSAFLIFSWLVFNGLDWIRWYPGQAKKLGIRIHFQKNLVPVSYLSVLAFSLKLAGAGEWVLFPGVLLLLPLYYVSGILLYLHFKDASELQAGYFSHNFYLEEKEKPWSP